MAVFKSVPVLKSFAVPVNASTPPPPMPPITERPFLPAKSEPEGEANTTMFSGETTLIVLPSEVVEFVRAALVAAVPAGPDCAIDAGLVDSGAV